MRSPIRRLLLIVLAFAVSACASNSPSGTVSTPANAASASALPAATGPEAIVLLSKKAKYELPIKGVGTISDGSLAISNRSSTPLVISKIEPIFENNQSEEAGLTVVGVKIASLGPNDDDFLSIERAFPPSTKVEAAWKDAVGETIQPATDVPAYVVFFGISVTGGTHRLTAARITFDANGSQFTAVFERNTVLCEAESIANTHC